MIKTFICNYFLTNSIHIITINEEDNDTILGDQIQFDNATMTMKFFIRWKLRVTQFLKDMQLTLIYHNVSTVLFAISKLKQGLKLSAKDNSKLRCRNNDSVFGF